MSSRNRLLRMGELCLLHGLPVPLDTLAHADDNGLLLTAYGEPSSHHINYHEGEITHGNTEANIHDL
jgi:hypothetical protein